MGWFRNSAGAEMNDITIDMYKALTPFLPTAPEGMHWEQMIWRENDHFNYTYHATWKLVPTIEVAGELSE